MLLDFIKANKGSLLSTVLVVGLGSAVMVTSFKVGQQEQLAPNVPNSKPLAAGSSCTLSFPVHSVQAKEAQGATSLHCVGLSATPLNGSAPLNVTYYALGYDLTSEIVETTYVFGDGEQKNIKKVSGSTRTNEQPMTHTYQKSGIYDALVIFTNNNGEKTKPSDLCKVKITVLP